MYEVPAQLERNAKSFSTSDDYRAIGGAVGRISRQGTSSGYIYCWLSIAKLRFVITSVTDT